MNVNLRHFFALAHIADIGRLSAAAEKVFMSQSALTQALRKLEDSAGVRLFERAGFGVTETPAGKLLVRRSRRATNIVALAESAIRSRHPGANIHSPLYRHVTTSQLRALSAVVATGSYSMAARRLGLAQPSVHRAAKEIEAIVGVALFPRGTRGIEPTGAAVEIARYANLVFAEIRQGFEEIRELRGESNSRISVGSLPLVRSEFLPMAIVQLLDKYPDARVNILDGPYVEQLHALRNGQIDWLLGALRNPAPVPEVVEELLFDQPLAVVVRPGHPLLADIAPPIEQLASLAWVAPRQDVPTRSFFDEFFLRSGVQTPTRIIECSSLIATRGLLLNSDRAALLSPLQVREDVLAGELAILIDQIPGSGRAIGMTIRDNWEPTMVQAEFANMVRELARTVPQ